MTRRNAFLAALVPAVAQAQEADPQVTDLARIAMSISPRYVVQAQSPDVDFVIQSFCHWLTEAPWMVENILFNYPLAYQFSLLDLWTGVRQDIATPARTRKRVSISGQSK